MKLLRIGSILMFILSAATYLGYQRYEERVVDVMGPDIRYSSDSISVSVDTSVEELLKDVTAYDLRDGDVSSSIMIENFTDFIQTGKRKITYIAFDSSNNISKAEREVVYTDYESPKFRLSKPLKFLVGESERILDNMTVEDCIDHDLTDKIKYNIPSYDFGQVAGRYPIEFQVTNSAGDTAFLQADVEFYYQEDKTFFTPEIILSKYIYYCKQGDKFDERSFLNKVIIGEEEYVFEKKLINNWNEKLIAREAISVSSNVNTKIPGYYHVNYSYRAENTYIGTVELIVVVEE